MVQVQDQDEVQVFCLWDQTVLAAHSMALHVAIDRLFVVKPISISTYPNFLRRGNSFATAEYLVLVLDLDLVPDRFSRCECDKKSRQQAAKLTADFLGPD
jgi:hypothetical protein